VCYFFMRVNSCTGIVFFVFHNVVTMRLAKKNDSRSRSADFGMGGAVIFAP
jgi:hypothetical protein